MMYAVRELVDEPDGERDLEHYASLAGSGDLAAFELLISALQGRVRSFTRRFLSDREAGDDAAQETFIKMWRALPAYTPQGKLMPWVFRIARNTCIAEMRRNSRKGSIELIHDLPSQVDPADLVALREAVRAAIATLPAQQREALLLREAGLSYEEIGVACECPVGTIRSRLNEAKKQLAAQLTSLLHQEVKE